MKKLLNFLKSRLASDRADAIIVQALIFMSVMILLLAISIDTQKNLGVKNERIDAIQTATSTATKTARVDGSLDWRVLDTIVPEYEHARFGGKKFAESGLDQRPGFNESVKTTREYSTMDKQDEDEGCLIGSDGEKYPQYKVTLDTKRGTGFSSDARTYSFTRKPDLTKIQLDSDSKTRLDPSKTYRVVTVEVIDAMPNFFGGFTGQPCQKFDLSASSIMFGTSGDLN